tara:strand:+ start:84 stop:1004 length:921 start_codon:yes stop_codon:yes gene_type:complete
MAKFNLDEYVMVEDRIVEFYKKYPKGSIRTELVKATDDLQSVIVKASVYITYEDSSPLATGLAQEQQGVGGFANEVSWVENAATSAIGRALANAGFQKKGEPRPSRNEMEKKDRVKGEAVSNNDHAVPPFGSASPDSNPDKKPKLTNTIKIKDEVMWMCNENKEFAKATFQFVHTKIKLDKTFQDDMEEWDNVQVNKFITKCKSYADKHKDEFENRKDVPSNVSDTWPGTKIITEGGDDLTDIPSGKWEGDPVSDSQLNFLNTLITECIDAGKDSMASEAKSRVNSGELTKKEASELIDKLKTAKG